MSSSPGWVFLPNEAREIEGPRYPGITTFMGSPRDSVIREAIQNSLDAHDEAAAAPVEVAFSIVRLDPASFGGASLVQALQAAIASPQNDEPHRVRFRRGLKLLKAALSTRGAGVPCLRISEENTTGADDTPREQGAPTKWAALTKGTGSSEKPIKDAAGSFGLGKFASFAATDLRTVLYSSAYRAPEANSGGDVPLHRRFQGRSILVAHETPEGPKRQFGYLGDVRYMPLCNDRVPPEFLQDSPGTTIYILGYEQETNWEGSAVRTAIKHFFHALAHGKLGLRVGTTYLSSDNIASFDTQVDNATAYLLRTSLLDPVATEVFDGIGTARLRILIDRQSSRRQIALVRDAGMLIADHHRAMKPLPLGRIPRHWFGYTAVVECLSEGDSSLLRDAESPQHNAISVDYIQDPDTQKKAGRALEALGKWIRTRIQEHAEPPAAASSENATELADLFPIEDPDGSHSSEDAGSRPLALTTPRQSNRPPPRTRLRVGRPQPTSGLDSNGEVVDPDEDRERKKKVKRKRRRRRSSATTSKTGITNVRFRPGTRHPTHSVFVSFDNPGDRMHTLRLCAVGEDGIDIAISVRAAFVGSRKIAAKRGKLPRLPVQEGTDRYTLEILTLEPVAGKSFHVVEVAD